MMPGWSGQDTRRTPVDAITGESAKSGAPAPRRLLLGEEAASLDGGRDALEGNDERAPAQVDPEHLAAGPHGDEGALHGAAQPLGQHALVPRVATPALRSDERRVGKECVRKGRSRWAPYQ